MSTEQNGVYTTALIAKAEFEMRVFERVSKDTGQLLIDEVKRLQELIAKATGEHHES